MKYTQRQWDRVVGYGKVPEQYSAVSKSYNRSTTRKTDGQNSTRGNKTREEVAKNYVTKDEMESNTDRVIRMLNKLEAKLDKLFEVKTN